MARLNHLKCIASLGLIAALAISTPALAADKLTVLLDWFVNPNHGPFIVAQEIGAFKRQNLDVTFVQPADPTMPPRMVAAGHGDIAVDYQPQLLVQVTNGLPLTRIGALVDRPMASLATLRGFGVNSIADFKGKRIGYNEVGGPAGLAAINTVLQTAHLSLRDVTLVNVGTALSTSLLTHRVDGVTVERNFESLEMASLGAKPIMFDFENYGVPAYENLILVVNSRNAGDPRYKRFLAAVREGSAYIKAHPDDGWRLFVHAYPNLNNKLNRAAWLATVPAFASDPAALNTARYAQEGQYLLANRVIKSNPPITLYTHPIR